MFIGKYIHTIDTKGRVTIPSGFRDYLQDGFVMTKGLDNCLFVYPNDQWREVEEKLTSLPLTNRDARAFMRFFFAGASKSNLDSNGRVLISQNLREYIKINKDLVIIGLSTRLEIWSKEEWDEYNSMADLSYEDIAEKMTELGI